MARIRVEVGAKGPHRRRGWADTPEEADALRRKFREEIAAEIGEGSKVLRHLGRLKLDALVHAPDNSEARADLAARAPTSPKEAPATISATYSTRALRLSTGLLAPLAQALSD